MKEKAGLERWQIEYNKLKNYAITNNLRNLITALTLAVKYHKGQYRDGGEPYVIYKSQYQNYQKRENKIYQFR